MKMRSKGLSLFISSWIARVISFLLALLIFASVKYLNMTDRIVTIPLQVSLPDSFIPESLVPSKIDIIISGDDNLIYLVDPQAINAYADFSNVSEEGIARVKVVLSYNDDAFNQTALTVSSNPDSVRILFREK